MKWKIFFVGLGLAGGTVGASAKTPSWYEPRASDLRLQGSCAVSGTRIYSLPEQKLVINPKLLAARTDSLELSFEKGTSVTATVFEVGPGGRLIFRDCNLNQVCVICQPGGEVRIENCALMQAYFPAADPVSTEPGSPTPKIVIQDSVISHSHIGSPVATGLTAKNSRFIISELTATQQDGANTVSSFNGCVFSQCTLMAGEVLMCSSQCWFSQCEYPGEFPQDFASYLPKPVLVQVAWSGLAPVSLPKKAGMVFFESIDASSLSSAGTRSGGPELASSAAAGQNLTDALSLADVNGSIAKYPSRITSTPSALSSTSTATPVQAPTVVAAGLNFKARLTSVNGLLIQQLLSGEEAGMVTKMSLTALPSLGSQPSVVKFNQSVGDDMQKALDEVSKFTQLRHGGLPGGHTVEVGFADKYVAKDGPSAAVACALLLEGAITGKTWDPAFAVTGDMNADGSVQPIGGVQAKIRGATKGACKLVGVPVKNEKSVLDVLILEGPAPLVGITVFGIKSFDEALLLAGSERPQALQAALTDFDNMRTVMLRDPRQIVPLLRTPHAAQRLQALLAAAPNCYSAKYLLMYVQGRAPRTLSIGGSIEAAQGSADAIVSSIDHDVDTNVSSLKGDELGTSLNKLRTLRPLLDPRVWPYVDNLTTYGDVIRSALLNPVRSGARYVDLVTKANKAAAGAKAAYQKLINDVQVREELGL
ncbi:S16 family serine protease [Prosthecobacter sp.]|uniref:S16 family serine protease n=1 Tax=Prosthecobacter sp. TaxID=1965333 RepID=UPI0037830002